jgi:hypothetical protein
LQQDEHACIKQDNPVRLYIAPEIRKVVIFSKRYPIPAFAIIGLISGTIVHYIFNDPEIGHWIWFIVLVIGGIPILFEQ